MPEEHDGSAECDQLSSKTVDMLLNDDAFAGALDDFCKLTQLLEMANGWETLVEMYPGSPAANVLSTCALQVRLVIEEPVEDPCDT